MSVVKNSVQWFARILAGFFAIATILILTGVLQARIVLTDSMEPSIKVNDLVFGASWLEPGVDEVALYRQVDASGNLEQDVVHRITAISEEGQYIFKGDNNDSEDAFPVARESIKGVIFLKLPGIGALFGIGGGIAVAAMILGIWAIVYGARRLRESRAADEETT